VMQRKVVKFCSPIEVFCCWCAFLFLCRCWPACPLQDSLTGCFIAFSNRFLTDPPD